jgi:hypothetical protein
VPAPDYYNVEDIADKTFYGLRFAPSTGTLTAVKVNDGTPVKLPELTTEGDPYIRKPSDYRAWVWTSNTLRFSWDNTTGHLLVEVV